MNSTAASSPSALTSPSERRLLWSEDESQCLDGGDCDEEHDGDRRLLLGERGDGARGRGHGAGRAAHRRAIARGKMGGIGKKGVRAQRAKDITKPKSARVSFLGSANSCKGVNARHAERLCV